MNGNDILLSVEGLTRRFGGLVAVSDVELSVARGEILGLIGPNGAGKTTVFNMLGGTFPPSSGRIRFDGTDVTGWPSHRMAQLGLTRTFQITSLFPTLSVLENVRAASFRRAKTGWGGAFFRTRAWREDEAALARRAEEILDFVALGHRRDMPAQALPYGEQRKLEIAVALGADPTLLLLDEPAAGMNPDEGAKLVQMIRAIRDRGVSVLLVEHHMKVVMGVCDRLVVLDHGVKIAEGQPQAVASHPEVIRVYLGREKVGA